MNRSPMQSVNLYQDSLKPARSAGFGRFPLALLPMALAGLLVLTGWWGWDGQQLSARLAEATAARSGLTAELEALRERVSKRPSDPLVALENETLTAQLRRGQQLIDLIDRGLAEDGGGIAVAKVLMALARQRPADLWLERIRLSSAGREVHLNGVMLHSVALTTYLDRLAAEPTFRGRSFNRLHISPDPRKVDRRLFDIDTRISVIPSDGDFPGTPVAPSETVDVVEEGVLPAGFSDSVLQEP